METKARTFLELFEFFFGLWVSFTCVITIIIVRYCFFIVVKN